VEVLRPFAGMRHLDVAGGTGDVAFRVLRAIRAAELAGAARSAALAVTPGDVTVCDINPDMLEAGKGRAAGAGLAGDAGLSWVVGNAERLPFDEASFDAYTIAFGIRNVTDRAAALAEARRVLRPGGRFLCLEFSQVTVPLLKEVYDAYSHHVIPRIGALVAKDDGSYRYLVESIRRFPGQDAWADAIEAAGFAKVGYESMSGGIVALHSGFKL
jgi:2-methoxy-6-polyprenyl-1,4-benzoquinol methylase